MNCNSAVGDRDQKQAKVIKYDTITVFNERSVLSKFKDCKISGQVDESITVMNIYIYILMIVIKILFIFFDLMYLTILDVLFQKVYYITLSILTISIERYQAT